MIRICLMAGMICVSLTGCGESASDYHLRETQNAERRSDIDNVDARLRALEDRVAALEKRR